MASCCQGETERRRGRNVVVAMDESEHSFHALEWALNTLLSPSLASTTHTNLTLLHAKMPPTSSIAFGGPETGYLLSTDIIASMERAQDKEIAAFMDKALDICRQHEIRAETKVVGGDPRDVICEVVEELNADFLVIGSHGYGAVKRALLGSVSDYCAHHAKCPIVIVRKPHKKTDQHDKH